MRKPRRGCREWVCYGRNRPRLLLASEFRTVERRSYAPPPIAITPRSPRTGSSEVDATSKRFERVVNSLGGIVDQRLPVRLIDDVGRDRNTRRQHLRCMPPAARNKEKFTRFQDEGCRDRFLKQREFLKVRLVEVFDQ